MVHHHAAATARKTDRGGQAFARGTGNGEAGVAFAAGAKAGDNGSVFDEDTGIDRARHPA